MRSFTEAFLAMLKGKCYTIDALKETGATLAEDEQEISDLQSIRWLVLRRSLNAKWPRVVPQ